MHLGGFWRVFGSPWQSRAARRVQGFVLVLSPHGFREGAALLDSKSRFGRARRGKALKR